MSLIAICDNSGRTIGQAEKSEAHIKGMLHRSVLFAVVKGGKLLVYLRGPDQTPGLCWDIPGGHADFADESIKATAQRELTEEIVAILDGRPHNWSASALKMLGKEDQIRSFAPRNRELSTAFAIRVPENACLYVQDEGEDGIVQRKFCFCTLAELRRWAGDGSHTLADGLRRFLNALNDDWSLRRDLYRVLDHQKWTIGFGCTQPGEPGCGCPDGDFYAEHEFTGPFNEAENAAREISREQYFGDFTWWLIPIEDADE
jgi:ADP-ribose pyrophosphatase YjhB (NUDIX family)